MTIYPNTGALLLAATMRTFLAASKMKLYQTIASPLSPSTVLADLTEADYDGYTEKTLTTWNLPYLDPAGGASIQPGTQQFDFVAAAGTTNVVLGFYILDAAGALVCVGSFDSPIPMGNTGDSIPINCSLNFGASS